MAPSAMVMVFSKRYLFVIHHGVGVGVSAGSFFLK